jgi:glutamate dehydrogenase (NAD(P)+)
MEWVLDTYMKTIGIRDHDFNMRACVTGKSVNTGGVNGRREAMGLGVYQGLKKLLSLKSFLHYT